MSTLDTVRSFEGVVEGAETALATAGAGLAAIEVAAEAAEEVGRAGRKLVTLLVVLAVVAGIAALACKLRGGGNAPSDATDA